MLSIGLDLEIRISGLGLTEVSVIMEEANCEGGNCGACGGQIYNLGMLMRDGQEQQKQQYLPRIASKWPDEVNV